jgi:hypothetical protein
LGFASLPRKKPTQKWGFLGYFDTFSPILQPQKQPKMDKMLEMSKI